MRCAIFCVKSSSIFIFKSPIKTRYQRQASIVNNGLKRRIFRFNPPSRENLKTRVNGNLFYFVLQSLW
jgi:hypothetical protein